MDTSALQVGGLVLCGGQSLRMGSDKAFMKIEDEYLLSRVVRVVQSVTQPVVVAGRKGQSLPPLPGDVLLAFDAIEEGGPLVGMASGFEQLGGKCDAVFVVSCDQPLIHPGFIQRLMQLLEDYQAVVVEHDGHLHSLSALYRIDTLETMKKLIEQGVRSAHQFVKHCRARIVSVDEVGDVETTLPSLRNINDPQSYEALMKELNSS